MNFYSKRINNLGKLLKYSKFRLGFNTDLITTHTDRRYLFPEMDKMNRFTWAHFVHSWQLLLLATRSRSFSNWTWLSVNLYCLSSHFFDPLYTSPTRGKSRSGYRYGPFRFAKARMLSNNCIFPKTISDRSRMKRVNDFRLCITYFKLVESNHS